MNIAILTSGGDAPGMNAAIRSIVRTGLKLGHKIFGVKNGYKGLIDDEIFELKRDDVSGMLSIGGTFLGTARSERFKELEYKKIAIQNLKRQNIEALIAIGGDGTALGALSLHNLGIKVIAIPGSIDNDVGGTDTAIGFHTALSTIVEAIDKIRDTSSSHRRCSIIETMGRDCGELAINSGISSGAELVITQENPIEKEKLFEILAYYKKINRRHAIIVITEHIYDVHALAKEISEKTSFETRATVLGHIQRGGAPVPFDRLLATSLGNYAIKLLNENKSGISVGIKNNKLVSTDIEKSVKEKRATKHLFNLLEEVL